MKFLLYFVQTLAIDICALGSPSITKTNKDKEYHSGELIFSDEFDYFDLETWNHEITFSGNSNWEFQMHINERKISFVENGSLHIKPMLSTEKYGTEFVYNYEHKIIPLSIEGTSPVDSCSYKDYYGCERLANYPEILNPVISAKIRTVNSFYFKYGRVDVRAKLPSGDWMWPAIWMMPRFNQYGKWPASGEVDIMESRGNRKLVDDWGNPFGCDTVIHALHFGPRYDQDGFEQFLTLKKNEEGFDKEFHVYSLEWTDEKMTFMIDNVTTKVIQHREGGFWENGWFDKSRPNPWKYSKNQKMAPFDQKFYLVINVAVGGMNNYFSDAWFNGEKRQKKPWRNDGANAYLKFLEAQNEWYPTWEGDRGALKVDYVRVYAI